METINEPEKGLNTATSNVIPDHPLYVIYRAQNNTAMILQYVSSVDNNYNLEVIATDIPLERVEYYMKHIIQFTEFELEGYKKAEASYELATTYKMQQEGWKGEMD